MDISAWLEPLMVSIQSAFVLGFILSAFFSAIPSPMNVLLVEQTLEQGSLNGIRISLAISLGGIFGLFIAALPFMFGINFLAEFFLKNASFTAIVMAIMLIIIGFFMMKKTNNIKKEESQKMGYALGAFLFTGLQPGNVLVNIAFVTSLQSFNILTTPLELISLFTSYFVGTMSVLLIYLCFANYIRSKIDDNTMNKINTFLGGIIVICGIGSLVFIPAL